MNPCAVDPGWLTQPRATVLAALIAVIAATIAYAGVLKTTSTTRRENRRAEKAAVLVEGQVAFANLTRLLLQIALTPTPEERAASLLKLGETRLNEIFDAVAISSAKFALYGFSDVTKASNKVVAAGALAHAQWNEDLAVEFDADEIFANGRGCDAALKRAMQSLK